ncbi:MAG TPA: D-isomer specific 2-hydroxyacid dehydrogenase family protein [Solirubrobacter sp.]|nr:D-isomer specific 2-hydroxyacid dehydrogenase family protein [Solirubrobacter sp.]
MPPAIHIGPDAPPHLVRAIEAGGGRVAGLDEADAVVWAGRETSFPALPSRVRWVQLHSAGVEPWLERIRALPGVRFTSAAGAYAPQVAEHALMLLLAGVRGLERYARAATWAPRDSGTLAGATVAVVGAGGIGRELIRRLEPHGAEILAVTRSGRDGTLPASRLPEIWDRADHVVLCAPATAGTRHLVGAAELARMRPHAWLVNVARGSLIDTGALVEALRERRIGGAALDVTDPEPLPDGHPLWGLALITPHVANPPSAMGHSLAAHVRENVRRFAAGEPLLAPIDPDAGY